MCMNYPAYPLLVAWRYLVRDKLHNHSMCVLRSVHHTSCSLLCFSNVDPRPKWDSSEKFSPIHFIILTEVECPVYDPLNHILTTPTAAEHLNTEAATPGRWTVRQLLDSIPRPSNDICSIGETVPESLIFASWTHCCFVYFHRAVFHALLFCPHWNAEMIVLQIQVIVFHSFVCYTFDALFAFAMKMIAISDRCDGILDRACTPWPS